jgi:uncharacterized protein (TIGR03083 family)
MRSMTTEPGPGTLLAAADLCTGFFGDAAELDWARVSPTTGSDVSAIAGHIVVTLLWYATDFAAGPDEQETLEPRVTDGNTPAELARTIRTVATVLARVLAGAEPGARGWHPHGLGDAAGFAAIACDELLVHTWDAAQGLARDFTVPPELAEPVLRRLFPWAPEGSDPWTTLLWANGRADLDGQEHQTGWRWQVAPLAEWDGTNPRTG